MGIFRNRPSMQPDSDQGGAPDRASAYSDAYYQAVGNARGSLAEEGSYFTANNATTATDATNAANAVKATTAETATSLAGGVHSATYTFSNEGNSFSGTFIGDGSQLANIVATDDTRVSKTGDTMTGLLTLSVDGVQFADGTTMTTSATPQARPLPRLLASRCGWCMAKWPTTGSPSPALAASW